MQQEKYLSKLKREISLQQEIYTCILFASLFIGVAIFTLLPIVYTVDNILDQNWNAASWSAIPMIILGGITYKIYKIDPIDFLLRLAIISLSIKKLINNKFYC